ncbi:MAG: pyrimidine-nucleoside phosphorylase [Clostridiales bacterium]|nr:pyrimidine-nucleoside phosphorylase [Clostridiales bacterium]
MRIYDIIKTKRDGGFLSTGEIEYFIAEYTAGRIPDYQASALLMAIYFSGMNPRETTDLTMAMVNSGERADLSAIEGIIVDKHSTGGVGDKTTLVIAPIVAACGVKVAKMSGRGLGHTGGTVDKLESIPGLQTSIDRDRFIEIVNRTGLCVIGQSGHFAPADKKLYALRDATATVDSIPLIASSIMSKKIASGSHRLLLDVKVGSGSFMKTYKEAETLAKTMVSIGEGLSFRTVALITNMDVPLGCAIGNSLEVVEAVNTLKGIGPEDLTEICVILSANMLYIADKGTLDECKAMAKQAIYSGTALECLKKMVTAQGGDASFIEDTGKFSTARYFRTVTARKDGYITKMNTENCGIASAMLGAGRAEKEDNIDFAAGIMLENKIGAKVQRGEPLATLYAEHEELFDAAAEEFLNAIEIGDKPQEETKIVLGRVEN